MRNHPSYYLRARVRELIGRAEARPHVVLGGVHVREDEDFLLSAGDSANGPGILRCCSLWGVFKSIKGDLMLEKIYYRNAVKLIPGAKVK